jgi:LPXTG-site transpeptidase (sortase) family protein
MTSRLARTLVVGVLALGAAPAHATVINIPAIHVRDRVTMNVNAGPAWWPTTGRPGGGDTVAIAGHRTTHTRPFHDLDKLKAGDRIYVRYGGRVHAYVMTSRRVLSGDNLHIADGVGHERLILTACARRDGSPTSLSYRIVIYALPKENT